MEEEAQALYDGIHRECHEPADVLVHFILVFARFMVQIYKGRFETMFGIRETEIKNPVVSEPYKPMTILVLWALSRNIWAHASFVEDENWTKEASAWEWYLAKAKLLVPKIVLKPIDNSRNEQEIE